jgi:hypothetical protein
VLTVRRKGCFQFEKLPVQRRLVPHSYGGVGFDQSWDQLDVVVIINAVGRGGSGGQYFPKFMVCLKFCFSQVNAHDDPANACSLFFGFVQRSQVALRYVQS